MSDFLIVKNSIERLHESALREVISLIPKKQRDARILSNLRPIAITLLNVDCRLIEKMMALRLKPILQYIINEDFKETLFHFYWQCTKVKPIWQWMVKYCQKITKEEVIDVNPKNILFNTIV